jgi:hypothetical protein
VGCSPPHSSSCTARAGRPATPRATTHHADPRSLPSKGQRALDREAKQGTGRKGDRARRGLSRVSGESREFREGEVFLEGRTSSDARLLSPESITGRYARPLSPGHAGRERITQKRFPGKGMSTGAPFPSDCKQLLNRTLGTAFVCHSCVYRASLLAHVIQVIVSNTCQQRAYAGCPFALSGRATQRLLCYSACYYIFDTTKPCCQRYHGLLWIEG